MNARIFIHTTKGSGGSLLDVQIDGYQVTDGTMIIHKITVNQKFVDDMERQIFQVGLNYRLAAIADFFLAQRGFATGKVVIGTADPVDLSTFAEAADMSVEGNGVVIADGDASPSTSDHTDFGTTAASGGTVVRTFTVKNLGSGTLNLTGSPIVAVGGTDANNFTVTAVPQSQVPPGGSVTFQVTFDPSSAAAKSATLSIANDGPAGKNPYNFSIAGTGS